MLLPTAMTTCAKKLALPQVWNSSDLIPPGQFLRWSDPRAAAQVLFAQAHTLIREVRLTYHHRCHSLDAHCPTAVKQAQDDLGMSQFVGIVHLVVYPGRSILAQVELVQGRFRTACLVGCVCVTHAASAHTRAVGIRSRSSLCLLARACCTSQAAAVSTTAIL